jgi:hypothetical protein
MPYGTSKSLCEVEMAFETILWTWGIFHTGVYVWAFMSKKR